MYQDIGEACTVGLQMVVVLIRSTFRGLFDTESRLQVEIYQISRTGDM